MEKQLNNSSYYQRPIDHYYVVRDEHGEVVGFKRNRLSVDIIPKDKLYAQLEASQQILMRSIGGSEADEVVEVYQPDKRQAKLF